jgi:hypothetical protein
MSWALAGSGRASWAHTGHTARRTGAR